MVDQDLFHIQLHPNKGLEAVEYAKKGLAQTGAIGLDFDRSALTQRSLLRKPLSSFSDADRRALKQARTSATQLKDLCSLLPGTRGLVGGGQTPVALVEISRSSVSTFVRRERFRASPRMSSIRWLTAIPSGGRQSASPSTEADS
jgi:hypothetical protein